jgi:HD superfamily phosphohydrolase
MQKAVRVLRFKNVSISEEEEQALYLAILLHDLGHGPFSHALEHFFISGVTHEDLSLYFMESLNVDFDGALTLAIQIFRNKHPRKFLYQLISSQLDMDRLDYLKRDSFYTGVVEGSINSDRLIAMLNVVDDSLVIEQKGIYSIEKFLLSRRFMYWQVYLHKTGLLAEQLLLRILQRARELLQEGKSIVANTNLIYFLEGKAIVKDNKTTFLEQFAMLDDYDVWAAIKEWQQHDDTILASLCKMIIQRKLPRIELSDIPFSDDYINSVKEKTSTLNGIDSKNLHYYIFDGRVSNRAYNTSFGPINVLLKDGSVKEWLDVDSQFKSSALMKPQTKYFLCYPKAVGL